MLQRRGHGRRVYRRLSGKAIHWNLRWRLRNAVKSRRTIGTIHRRCGSAIVDGHRDALGRIPWQRVRVLGSIFTRRIGPWPGVALLLFLHFVDLEPISRLRFGLTITTSSTRIQPRATLGRSSPRYPGLPRVQDAIETWCNRPSGTWRWQAAVTWRAKRTLRRGQGELARYSQSWLICGVVLSFVRLVSRKTRCAAPVPSRFLIRPPNLSLRGLDKPGPVCDNFCLSPDWVASDR